ncbi:MAG: ion transporter [Magnetospirillum sp. WYHS-4]
MNSLRQVVHRQLDVRARRTHGLSTANQVIVSLILVGALIDILSTEPRLHDAAPGFFSGAEWGLGLAFTLEYVLRLWAAGERPEYAGWRRLRYLATPMALIDLAATLPLWLSLGESDAFVLRLLRLLRILRLAKFGRYSLAMSSIAEAVRERRFELAVSAGVATIFMVIAAALLYLVEGEAQPEAFGSIPRALWWAVVTLTTVGYGDVYPITMAGRICAGLVAVLAIGLIAMPTGILAAAFSDAFQRRRRGEPSED